jgi:uncharacterized oxidoreductase
MGSAIMKLEGNTILITGGSNGIGLELAREFRSRGNTVIITGRDQARLDAAQRQVPGLYVIRSDVSQATDIEALHREVMARLPDLNVLINNAGVMRKTNLHDQPESLEDFTAEIDINFTGPVRLTQLFLPDLKRRANAAIVNVTSGLAFVPLPISPIYCATKAALHSFSLSLRAQLAKTHVKVFEIAPPATQTDLLGSFQAGDLEGTSVMNVQKMVQLCLKGLRSDRLEIRPGQSNLLKLMNRLAPEFILSQLSKPVAKMLEG